MKNIIYLYILFSLLFPRTLYFSKTLDSVGTETDTDIIDFEIKNTYSFGYEHPVWQKRKVKYDVYAGGEILTNSDMHYLNVYVLARYNFNKFISVWSSMGLGFYDPKDVADNSDDSEFENNFLPNSKGGYTYGIGMTYNLTKKFPISLHKKYYTASEVRNDEWLDITYARFSLQLGYAF